VWNYRVAQTPDAIYKTQYEVP